MTFCLGITFGASVACSSPLAAAQITMTQVAGYRFSDYFRYTWPMSLISYFGILLFVLLVRKQVHWTWTAVRMTILANVFAIGTIHGGLRSLYPYVLEILIWLSIGEQGIQALQKWINQGKGGS